MVVKKDKYHRYNSKSIDIIKIGNWYSVAVRNKYGYLFGTPKRFNTKKDVNEFIKKVKLQKYSNVINYYRR